MTVFQPVLAGHLTITWTADRWYRNKLVTYIKDITQYHKKAKIFYLARCVDQFIKVSQLNFYQTLNSLVLPTCIRTHTCEIVGWDWWS